MCSITELDHAGKPAPGFDEVYNFRNVAARSNILRKNGVNIYRSAMLEHALDSDCERFVETYGIKTIVNMRGNRRDGAQRMLKHYSDISDGGKDSVRGNCGKSLLRFNLITKGAKDSLKELLLTWRFAGLISFAATVHVLGRLFRNVTFGSWKVRLEQHLDYLDSVALNRLVANPIFDPAASGGPLGTLYVALLEHSQETILEILQVIAEPANRPAIFHCTSGKDRTGLIAMLILGAAGDVSLEEIIEDYNRSHAWALSDRHKSLATSRDTSYLTAYTWEQLAAPETAIRAALRFLDENYGGIVPYLDGIGFDRSWREKLLLPDENGVAETKGTDVAS
ncbi:hypothetical protein ACHAWF_004260 [Thalassiosira exigua]